MSYLVADTLLARADKVRLQKAREKRVPFQYDPFVVWALYKKAIVANARKTHVPMGPVSGYDNINAIPVEMKDKAYM